MGWEVQNEEAPNKIVHAEDLASALAKLHAHHIDDPTYAMDEGMPPSPITRRRRTGSSTIVYDPQDHGDSPNLPAIAVEDTTETPMQLSPNDDAMEGIEGPISQQKAQGKTLSTARPPIELMH